MLIKDLKEPHPFIYYTALLRHKACRGVWGGNSEVFHFNWEQTREGVTVWGHISRKNYDPFYEFHGRNVKTGLLDKKQL